MKAYNLNGAELIYPYIGAAEFNRYLLYVENTYGCAMTPRVMYSLVEIGQTLAITHHAYYSTWLNTQINNYYEYDKAV